MGPKTRVRQQKCGGDFTEYIAFLTGMCRGYDVRNHRISVLWFPSSLSAWGNPNFKKGGMSGIVQWADMYSSYRPKTAGDEHYKGRKATSAQDIEQIIRISLPSLLSIFFPKTTSLLYLDYYLQSLLEPSRSSSCCLLLLYLYSLLPPPLLQFILVVLNRYRDYIVGV